MESEPPQMQVASRYALLVFIWSTTPLAVVLSIRELHPVWALALRFALAAPLAALCLWLLGERLPFHREAVKSYAAVCSACWGPCCSPIWARPTCRRA